MINESPYIYEALTRERTKESKTLESLTLFFSFITVISYILGLIIPIIIGKAPSALSERIITSYFIHGEEESFGALLLLATKNSAYAIKMFLIMLLFGATHFCRTALTLAISLYNGLQGYALASLMLVIRNGAEIPKNAILFSVLSNIAVMAVLAVFSSAVAKYAEYCIKGKRGRGRLLIYSVVGFMSASGAVILFSLIRYIIF